MTERYDAEPVLERLKDFQRRTVDTVFQRLYDPVAPSRRFLVADEVGLGKTMVARGVIARTLEHLHDKVDRIDIVYVCSNAAIAAQNVARLKPAGHQGFSMASRLTLLPTQVSNLQQNRVNFVSFTPGTALDLKYRTGAVDERAVLFRMLRAIPGLDRAGLLHLLQGQAGRERWEKLAESKFPVDEQLSEKFRSVVLADPELVEQLTDITGRFHRYRESLPAGDSQARNALVGELRQRLARVCLDALEPDLVILDEFQRFRELLDGDDSMASLARDLFSYQDVRVLMLSATPYKLLTLHHETDDNHYSDFLRTLRFLFEGDSEQVEALQADLQHFRLAMLGAESDLNAALDLRSAIEGRLRQVMCRTERVGMTARRDAMLSEKALHLELEKSDLQQALLADQVATTLGARDPIEYWKSSPYLLNFMKDYDLRNRLKAAVSNPSAELLTVLRRHEAALLRTERFQNYEPIEAANARLRTVMDRTINRGLWRLLWLPPSLPYWQPGGAYATTEPVTKALVFSEWNVVPDALSTLVSYEAERRMVAGLRRGRRYDDKISRPLEFRRDQDQRLASMPVLALLYPSPFLASVIDPLELAMEGEDGLPVSGDVLVARVADRLAEHLRPLATHSVRSEEDRHWYWAAIALIDGHSQNAKAWCSAPDGWRAQETTGEEGGTLFRDHLERFASVTEGMPETLLGKMPDDLPKVLARLCLAGPGVIALRALRRVAPELCWDDRELLTAAAQVSSGLRTMFNLPESVGLLRGDGDENVYWRKVLEHCLDGNLQSVLDEHVHVLRESLGVMDSEPQERVRAIAENLRESLSLRSATLQVDELTVRDGRVDYAEKPFKARCRFALRFGELHDDNQQKLARVETVRDAFNSPFRPFVLASTSIGQEGLDFHLWCHAVVHWNLPANPVDFEQREGRVHRYKGHAVRKNLAQNYGLAGLRGHWLPGADPWSVLFERARADRPAGTTDLVPYWLYEVEGGASIERWVPMLPLSREVARYENLKKNLALYRLVFGQPRQEDLLSYLGERMTMDDAQHVADRWRLSLEPGREPMPVDGARESQVPVR